MAITRNETIRLAKEIKTCVEGFLANIGQIPNRLSSFIDNVNSLKNDINKNFSVREINENCTTALNKKVVKPLNEMISDIENMKKTVVKEANKYIRSLQDNYNNARDKDESYLTLLLVGESASSTTVTSNAYQHKGSGSSGDQLLNNRVTLGGSTVIQDVVGKDDKISGTNETVIIPSGNNGKTDNTQSGNYQYSDLTLNSNNSLLNSYLSSDNFDSNTIPEWNNYIDEFLKNNNLDNYISQIVVENNQLICIMKDNSKQYLSKVNNINDLLICLKAIIK